MSILPIAVSGGEQGQERFKGSETFELDVEVLFPTVKNLVTTYYEWQV